MVKNVVFDVGNVLLNWNPLSIIKSAIPNAKQPSKLAQGFFNSDHWKMLNEGKIQEHELPIIYQQTLGINLEEFNKIIRVAKDLITPMCHSIKLLDLVNKQHIPMFVLTNNTLNIMSYLLRKYTFWTLFLGIVCSASTGYRKPNKKIFEYMLSKFSLDPLETLYIDDNITNIRTAKLLNFKTIHFYNIKQCKKEMFEAGLVI